MCAGDVSRNSVGLTFRIGIGSPNRDCNCPETGQAVSQIGYGAGCVHGDGIRGISAEVPAHLGGRALAPTFHLSLS